MYKLDDQKVAAYLDGELSFNESAAFEQELPAIPREMLQSEVTLEARLAETLRGPSCPDALWKSLKRQMKSEKSSAKRFMFPQQKWVWLPLAASLVIMAGLFVSQPDPAFVERVSTVAALKDEVVLSDPSSVLAEIEFDLTVLMESQGHHAIEVLGGYSERLAGDPVAIICISCCGEPIRILVTRRESRAAEALLRRRNRENIQTVAWRGEYQLAVISDHPAEDALRLFQEV